MSSFKVEVERAGGIHVTVPPGTPVYIHHETEPSSQVKGPGPTRYLSEYDCLKRHPDQVWSPKSLAEALGTDNRSTWYALKYLSVKGYIQRLGEGSYQF